MTSGLPRRMVCQTCPRSPRRGIVHVSPCFYASFWTLQSTVPSRYSHPPRVASWEVIGSQEPSSMYRVTLFWIEMRENKHSKSAFVYAWHTENETVIETYIWTTECETVISRGNESIINERTQGIWPCPHSTLPVQCFSLLSWVCGHSSGLAHEISPQESVEVWPELSN